MEIAYETFLALLRLKKRRSGMNIKRSIILFLIYRQTFEKGQFSFKFKSKIPDFELGRAIILTNPVN